MCKMPRYSSMRSMLSLICLRSNSRAVRIARLWEDRITVTFVLGGVEMEGPAKDLNRIVSAFEYRLRGE